MAASGKNDRDTIRIMESLGGRSEVCREQMNLTIERFYYSEELPGYIRTGATPCASGADLRNNKFVHIYSLKEKQGLLPEDYLVPLSYKKQWNENAELSVYTSGDREKKGRQEAKKVLLAYDLEDRLVELFSCVYRCLLAGEKPLSFVNGKKRPEEFGEFSRQVMILVHYLLPKSLRKEADYVSYVQEDSQETHFLFRREGGNYVFDFLNRPQKEMDYVLLEKEFYEKLADAFIKENDEFEHLMEELDSFLCRLNDKRNQLEKCIFAFMASEAGKAEKKEVFFTGVERLMYWARKDESLIPAIKEATQGLDFHAMEEEELLSYLNLLLTGAGGSTKKMVFEELNRMLCYYYKCRDSRFDLILDRIRKKNLHVYEQILKENEKENGFTKMVLFQPIENKGQLEEAIQNHGSFLEEEDYRSYVAQSAYTLYQKEKSKKNQERIEKLGKSADQNLFVKLKQKDVEKVLGKASHVADFLDLTDQMEIDAFEEPIRTMIYQMAFALFQKDYPKLLPEFYPGEKPLVKREKKIGERSHEDDVRRLLLLSEHLSMKKKMEQDLYDYYEKLLLPVFSKLNPKELILISFWNQEDGLETEIYFQVMETIALNRYMILLKEKKEDFYTLDTKEWIHFVLKITNAVEKREKKTAKKAITETKNVILGKKDIFFLAKANQALKNHGVAAIRCPKTLWDSYQVSDFGQFYKAILDITLLKCEESPVYQAMEILYRFTDQKISREEEKKIGSVLKKEPAVGEELLKAMAGLWGKNETLNLDVFYPLLEDRFGQEEAASLMEEYTKENEEGKIIWKDYAKKRKKEVERKMSRKEKQNPWMNVVEDIMSGSIWAVLLGFYGFLFVTLRETTHFLAGYYCSIFTLVFLVLGYLAVFFFGKRKKMTPGRWIYISGVAVFLMNLGLCLDSMKVVKILFVACFLVAFALKVVYYFWKNK